jgi:hypothetical protein
VRNRVAIASCHDDVIPLGVERSHSPAPRDRLDGGMQFLPSSSRKVPGRVVGRNFMPRIVAAEHRRVAGVRIAGGF